MNKLNENRPGYKKTRVGWIPKEWTVKKGHEIAMLIAKGSSPKWQGFSYQSEGVLFITSENVRDGFLDISTPKYLPYEFSEKQKNSILSNGDILINIVGASIGRICKYDISDLSANINQAVCLLRLNKKTDSDFILFYLQHPLTIKRLLSTQVDSARPNLSLGNIRSFYFLTPPLPEQKKIAEILSAWDRAIEQIGKLIDTKEKRVMGFVQRLIADKCDNWDHLKSKDIFDSISEKNTPDEELLSVTQDRGVIPRTMLEGKVMSPEGSTAMYKLIKEGDFVISLRSFQGGIEYSEYQGIISPAYTVLRPKIELHSDFYRHFFKTYLFIEKYLRIAVIGIRDGKQISIPDFMTVKIPCPPLGQQKEIARTLSIAQHEIDILKKLADAYRKQKRGLMQKLLTGAIRVKE